MWKVDQQQRIWTSFSRAVRTPMRAEDEARENEDRLQTMRGERADLTQALATNV